MKRVMLVVLVGLGLAASAYGQSSKPPPRVGFITNPLGSPCPTLAACFAAGFELKSSTAVALTETNGDRRVIVTHYLRGANGTMIECSNTWYPDGKTKEFSLLDVESCGLMLM